MGDVKQWLTEPAKAADIASWFRIAVFIGGIIFSYASIKFAQNEQGKKLDSTLKQTTRIERYLSAHDPNYWQTVKQLGDEQ